jgi:hypothetical protein
MQTNFYLRGPDVSTKGRKLTTRLTQFRVITA